MKITNFKILQNVKDLDSLVRYSDINFELIIQVLNGNVDLIDNGSNTLVSVNFLKANTQYPFVHGLGRVPRGYLSAGMNVAASVFNGTTPNSINLIYLQASAISNGKVLVF